MFGNDRNVIVRARVSRAARSFVGENERLWIWFFFFLFIIHNVPARRVQPSRMTVLVFYNYYIHNIHNDDDVRDVMMFQNSYQDIDDTDNGIQMELKRL